MLNNPQKKFTIRFFFNYFRDYYSANEKEINIGITVTILLIVFSVF